MKLKLPVKILFVSPALLLIALCFSQGCKYDKEELLSPPVTPPANVCATTPAAFNANVLPLIINNCAVSGCHDASAAGGLILQNYNQIRSARDRINVRAVVQKTMPPFGGLPTSETNKIKCWIEGGALNN